jgi:ABC-type transport system involved in multi-copper enzyme maturation permease subunit
MVSYFPKALLFREWRQQRVWILLAAAIVMCLPGFRLLSDVIRAAQEPSWAWQAQFVGLSDSIQQDFDLAMVKPLLSFVAVGLGVMALCLDRSSGGLTHALSGPVKRAELLRTKFFVTWFGLLLILVLYGVFTLMECVVLHLHAPSLPAAASYIFQMAAQSAIFAVAFALSTAVSNLLIAGLCAFGVNSIPILIYELSQSISNGGTYFTWKGVENLSPLIYGLDTSSRSITVWVFIWLLLVCVMAYLVAQHLFDTSEVENFSSFYIFPVLWKWTIGCVCAGFGLITAALCASSEASFLVVFALSTFAFWVIASRAIRYYNRTRNA